MGSSKTPPPPEPPDWKAQYEAGAQTSLDFGPDFARQEYHLRKKFGPAYADLAGKLYNSLAPRLAATNLKALQKTDPESLAMRDQLFSAVRDDLGLGYGLDPAMQSQLTAQIRGAEAARGNVLGPAPVAAESMYLGDKAMALRQQRLSNATGFLSAWKPQDSFNSLLGAGSGPAQSMISAYSGGNPLFTNQNAGMQGVQAGQGQYTQQLAAYGQNPIQPNPWMGALGGAASGAAAGTAVSPGYGTAIGAIVGGAAGYLGTA